VIVVADTSVVINLCTVARAELLRDIFQNVLIPPVVEAEFHRLAAMNPRFRGLSVPGWILVIEPTSIPSAIASNTELDPGEVAALALAIEKRADAILLDEMAGRRAAQALGLRSVGILGVLLQAKTAGLIANVRTDLEALRKSANFWISDALANEVLRLAGEAR
jgi:hypothetical protein